MSSLLAGVVGQGIHVVFGNTTAREFLVFRSLAVTNARQQIGGLYDTTDKCVDSLNRPQNEAGSCRPPRPAGQPACEAGRPIAIASGGTGGTGGAAGLRQRRHLGAAGARLRKPAAAGLRGRRGSRLTSCCFARRPGRSTVRASRR